MLVTYDSMLQALAKDAANQKNKRKPVCKQTSLPPNFTFNVRPPSPDADEENAGMLGIMAVKPAWSDRPLGRSLQTGGRWS